MDFRIRTATDADASDLQRYAERLFAERPPGIYQRPAPTLEEERDFIRSRTLPVNSTLLIAWQDGRVVGLLDFLGGTLSEETHTGTFGLSVDRDHRDQGIGTALIEELLAWAVPHGIRRIEVRAWSNNPRAIGLYERLGFSREGRLAKAVRTKGEDIDVIVLARLIEG